MKSKAQMGRPKLLNDELIAKAKKYLKSAWITEGDAVPSLVGLACYLDISLKTIHNYKNDESTDADFLHTLEMIDNHQHRQLLNGGLKGELNAQIVKLGLFNHGYSDKAQVDNTSSDGSMTPHAPVFNLNPVRPKSDD